MSDAKQQNVSVPTIVISGAVVLAIGAGVYALSQKTAVETTPAPETANNGTDTNANGTNTTNNSYKDGTYSATGDYISPGGPETVGITLTLENGIITAASAEVQATLPASVNWQTQFSNGLSAAVVGKSLDEVKLDKVSGSSLTPSGFNEAVAEIKTEAKV
ncbi:calcium-binding protein [Patescibacteria group bacterium]|jgi:uncharacterized protein with FMN-binding domain|nr:calcium-binding protein [Patescibacteria group bacterium]